MYEEKSNVQHFPAVVAVFVSADDASLRLLYGLESRGPIVRQLTKIFNKG